MCLCRRRLRSFWDCPERSDVNLRLSSCHMGVDLIEWVRVYEAIHIHQIYIYKTEATYRFGH